MAVRILVIVPAYNEADSIASTIENIKKSAPGTDILVINDGSKDSTLQILRDSGVPYLNLRTNLGIGGAVQSGYIYARENQYDYAVQIDADGQHDPAYILDMVRWMQENRIDVGIGSRFIKKQGFQSSTARRMGIRFLSNLIRLCCGVRVFDVTSGYRIANKRLIEVFARDYSDDYPEPDAIMTAVLNNAKVEEYPVIMRERMMGVSSIGLRKSVYYMVKVSLSIMMHSVVQRGV